MSKLRQTLARSQAGVGGNLSRHLLMGTVAEVTGTQGHHTASDGSGLLWLSMAVVWCLQLCERSQPAARAGDVCHRLLPGRELPSGRGA